MPIEVALPVRVLDQDEFHQIDKRVTGIAFDTHNEFGRYLDEPLYQRELKRRCLDAGLCVEREVRIRVSIEDFYKDYFIDHLVNEGVIVETKAVVALAPAHRGQTLNYLFLCALHHATLLNFRTERVQHEFVSTRLTPDERKRFELCQNRWRPLTSSCRRLHAVMLRLLTEWGAYLDPILYRDALTHFLGGEGYVYREVEVYSGDACIGKQKMHLLTDDIAFSVTTSTHHPETVHTHQQRFLKHTKLRAIQWINLNHSQIEFRTVTKSCFTES